MIPAINHTILIKKLEKYGIRGLPLQLLASYLTDWQQYTIVNQYKSKSRDVICGIPQGSTLDSFTIDDFVWSIWEEDSGGKYSKLCQTFCLLNIFCCKKTGPLA